MAKNVRPTRPNTLSETPAKGSPEFSPVPLQGLKEATDQARRPSFDETTAMAEYAAFTRDRQADIRDQLFRGIDRKKNIDDISVLGSASINLRSLADILATITRSDYIRWELQDTSENNFGEFEIKGGKENPLSELKMLTLQQNIEIISEITELSIDDLQRSIDKLLRKKNSLTIKGSSPKKRGRPATPAITIDRLLSRFNQARLEFTTISLTDNVPGDAARRLKIAKAMAQAHYRLTERKFDTTQLECAELREAWRILQHRTRSGSTVESHDKGRRIPGEPTSRQPRGPRPLKAGP